MTRSSHHLLTAALALVLAAVPCAASGQAMIQAIPGTTDADRLGDEMRKLASNPRDIDALIRAGDLSMGLGDLSGAAALFARAEKVNPRDGRAKAGMASILVRSERPGEALRYYAQAEGFGLDPRTFAADRGLAYDLIGQQDRAQRDYRVALRDAPDDETTRRYALSLGISGKQELALQQLGPLLLKSDRGAWRSRAFIMAMNGDVAGAAKIATTMMPAGTAQGLQPFFQRLPTLPASDRAFAVHFGEVHATPARLADARMAPPMGMLAADPTAPVMMAAVTPQPVTTATSGKKGKRDRRDKPERVQMAAVTRSASTPVPITATIAPAPSPVRSAPTVPATIYAAPVQLAAAPMQMAQALPPRTVPSPQPSYVANSAVQTVRTSPAAEANSVVAATVRPSVSPTVPVTTTARVVPAPATVGTTVGTLPQNVATQMAVIPAGQGRTDPTRSANALAASAAASVPTQQASGQQVPVQQVPGQQYAPVQSASAGTPTPGFSSAPTQSLASTSTPSPVTPVRAIPTPVAPTTVAAVATPRTHAVAASEDSILARIVAGLSIPASELDVAPMRPAPVVTPGVLPAASPMSEEAGRVLAEANAKAERDAAAKAIAAKTLVADKLAADKKAAADKKVAARKAIADKKALAEKKAAAAEKLAADKAAAEEKRIARANPERVWVQVSTGATEGDLPKAWKKAKAKAPTVFGSRGGWTAPWKATNRVLAGPFKTDAEARTFVNQLAKEGVPTFTFTSDPGEIITKLPAK
ncbi:tetratricopeptide repeat protein [Sphingomonas sp. Leaf34]|uniref:tetratricopeptide repeat protein n=1 Tax=Sphingomonas sp. Leaf34 TaxID=1736216 RepID=UPI0009E964B5|nr:SPOR domain-containing protein [Sphingomonas sp. Leaf34]